MTNNKKLLVQSFLTENQSGKVELGFTEINYAEPRYEKLSILHILNKCADELRGNRLACHSLLFSLHRSRFFLNPQFKATSRPGLCRIWSETANTGFLMMQLILSAQNSSETDTNNKQHRKPPKNSKKNMQV